MVIRFALIGLMLGMSAPAGAESQCFGQPHAGRLEDAARPPVAGANFRAYCRLCVSMGRTYGHSRAVAAMLAAYRALEHSHPDTRFVYGEIGWPQGGPFRPHRTHQNGLSIDFMSPIVPDDAPDGEPPTALLNRFGYDLEYDEAGALLRTAAVPDTAEISEPARIDFDAIAAHLLALADAAEAEGGSIARVFFAPDLQPALRATRHGEALFARLTFNSRQSWVRHDDHYHVDFAFPCLPL